MIEEITTFGDKQRRFIDSETGTITTANFSTATNTTGVLYTDSASTGTWLWNTSALVPGTVFPFDAPLMPRVQPPPVADPEPLHIKTERRIKLR